ncbi:MAG: PEGA domain-containing protein [Methanoregulaceae archaeon]|nr:MAG: PEGA domain-containing protein [Methanoregulaceae archaeon]
MFNQKPSLMISVLVVAVLILAGSTAASSGIQTSMGDEVTISGYATSGPYVYLFLTGPNLPENGVALHDITKRADKGGFTKVSVDGDDRWTYTWHTGSINGRLDDGTYTVWVVSSANDRSNLATADFRTIAVTLGKPFVTVDTPVQPGTMDLQSVPEGASVTINGDYRGKTPFMISGLSPSTYAVTFSRFGFLDLTTQVTVQGGKNAEVIATLQPETGTLVVNSTPPGARVLLDGTDAGLSPLMLGNISAGNHTVMLEKDGFIAVTRNIGIIAGQTYPVDIVLVPVSTAVPQTTRAAGLAPAMAGALLVILLGVACFRRDT